MRQKRFIKITALDIVLALIFFCGFAYICYRIKIGLNYKWHWETIFQYLFRYDLKEKKWVTNLIMQGFFTTIRLSIWASVLAMILGIFMGFCRTGKRLLGQLLGMTYVEIIRNLPPLVLIFIFYFFVSGQIIPVTGLEDWVRELSPQTQNLLSIMFAPPRYFSAFLSAVVTLAVFEGAYITEIVRAGIQSIEQGQWEASSALGMSRHQQMRHIILPQAFARILPPLAGQFISTIKDSSIVSIISIQELTFQGMELMSATYMTFEIWITVTILYLSLTLSCSLAVDRLEIHLRRGQVSRSLG